MLTLENISDKLVLIPRAARVSALRAQLTALNHRLPGEVRFHYIIDDGLRWIPSPAYLCGVDRRMMPDLNAT
jgi:hypothetical protein